MAGNPKLVMQRAGASARNERTETGAGPSIVRPHRTLTDRNILCLTAPPDVGPIGHQASRTMGSDLIF